MSKLSRLITTLSLTLSLALAPIALGGTIYSTFGDTWSFPHPSTFGGFGCFSVNDPGEPSLYSMKKAWSFIAPQTANADAVEVALMRPPYSPAIKLR